MLEPALPSGDPADRPTVVVCEDDEATLELLCDQLAADELDPLPAPTGSDALRLCRFNGPDLLLLDMVLPDGSGMDVLREVRSAHLASSPYDPNLGVIVLSGRGRERDRVRGLEAGADDYLLKPFGYSELLARIRAVLRRRLGNGRTTRVEGLRIDHHRRQVTVGGAELKLSAKEFDLLSLLASAPERVFTKQELLEAIWGDPSLGRSRTLESHASRLRGKLDPEGRRFIVNCWGVGYRLLRS